MALAMRADSINWNSSGVNRNNEPAEECDCTSDIIDDRMGRFIYFFGEKNIYWLYDVISTSSLSSSYRNGNHSI